MQYICEYQKAWNFSATEYVKPPFLLIFMKMNGFLYQNAEFGFPIISSSLSELLNSVPRCIYSLCNPVFQNTE